MKKYTKPFAELIDFDAKETIMDLDIEEEDGPVWGGDESVPDDF